MASSIWGAAFEDLVDLFRRHAVFGQEARGAAGGEDAEAEVGQALDGRQDARLVFVTDRTKGVPERRSRGGSVVSTVDTHKQFPTQ